MAGFYIVVRSMTRALQKHERNATTPAGMRNFCAVANGIPR